MISLRAILGCKGAVSLMKGHASLIAPGMAAVPLLCEDAACREPDLVRVKGKGRPAAIREPFGLIGGVGQSPQELTLFQQALRMYRRQEWDQAELQLFNLLKIAPKVYGTMER